MTDLTHDSFTAFVSAHRFAVVHFWAAWNGYDVDTKQLLEHRIPVDLRREIAVGRVDVDDGGNLELCLRHGIRNIPFLALYRDGVLMGTLTGKHDEHVVFGRLRRLVS